MSVKRARGGKSVFKKILVSYVLMVLIPVIGLGSILYYYNVINYRKDIESLNFTKLNQVKSQMDSELKKLKDVTYHISTNSEILDANVLAEGIKKEPEIVSQIQAYAENYAFLNDILFYYRGDKNIYTTQGGYYYHDFENDVQRGWSLEWWKAGFFGNLNRTISTKAMLIGTESPNQLINNRLLVLIHPVPYLSTSPEATIVYTIREDTILSKFENFFGSLQGNIFVFDEFYNLITSNNQGQTDAKSEILERHCKGYRDTGIFDTNLEGNKYIGMRAVSEEMGWSYIVIMPHKQFFQNVTIMRRTILQIISMTILIGSIIAFLMSRYSYRPIGALTSYIKNQGLQQTDDPVENEFDIIRYSFEQSYEKNRKLIVQMNTQNTFVRDQCLVRILRGNFKDTDDLDYLLKCSNLKFQGKAYFSIVLSTNMRGLNDVKIENILSLLEDIFFIDGRGYGVELVQEKMIGMIISIEKEIEDFKAIQTSIARDILSLIKNNFEMSPIIGVGETYQDIIQLNFSFLEALSALYDSPNDNNSSIFFFDDMKAQRDQLSHYPIQEQSLYIESLKQGNERVALITIRDILQQIAHNVNSYFMVKCVCFDILNNMIKSIDREHIGEFSERIKQAATANTIYEFGESMEEFTEEFCEYIRVFEREKDNKLKEDLIKFVNQNFTSDQISLDVIANKFDISPTYASKFFREETGINFTDYLTTIRLEYAKEQLRKTDKLIKDIALEIGYIDASSFSRKFRALEGITPGQYRDMTK